MLFEVYILLSEINKKHHRACALRLTEVCGLNSIQK